ncbi:MAG: Ku protein [Solirubrobacterales bacterium]|nr:Ku protein [Solirubrobacterales bacterium]MBV9797941.1 Ku protein [Solirubrobacterales bacterium]
MARSLWTGSLSFGLVNVPVSVLPAVRDLDLHFRQLHEKDAAPIEVQRWCSKEDVEVPYEEITHGYELEDGGQVIVSDLELEAIEPRRTRTIEIEQFIELQEADPIYFDHPYFLVPASEDDGARRAYRLLTDVMGRTDRAALGRFVMRAKEYLAIVRERDGALTLTTMMFADEVRTAKDVDAATQKSHKPTRRQLDAAVAVIEELTCDWDPAKHKDRYQERLRRVVAHKRKGGTVQAPEAQEQPAPAPDLMDALERTLEELGRGGSGRSTNGKR